MNAFPPQQSEFYGTIPEDRPIQTVSYMDPSIPREHSSLQGLQQRDVYSNSDGERWPVSGRDLHDCGPNASFQSQYSGKDSMMWQSQQNEEVRMQNIMLWFQFFERCSFQF